MIKDVMNDVQERIDCAHFAEKSYVEVEVSLLEKVMVYLSSVKEAADNFIEEASKARIVHKSKTQIFKYEVIPTDIQIKEFCGSPISAMVARGKMYIYAPYVKDAPTKRYEIRIAGTGHSITDIESYTFLGTVSPIDGLMFHIFYKEVQ